MSFYLKALKLFGTPLQLEFRQGANPFAGRAGARTDRKAGGKGCPKGKGRGTGAKDDESNGPRGRSAVASETDEARGRSGSNSRRHKR